MAKPSKTEAPWPAEPMPADLYWSPDSDRGWLHFTDPRGDYAVVPVSVAEPVSTGTGLGNVWKIELPEGDGIATVSPSIHWVGAWHSPNPVRFLIERRAPGERSRFRP